jgi:prophage tail gpP-like protein
MKKIPVMTATVNADTAHRTVTVVVEHADWQSFSRAVEPRAKKEFKRWVSENIVFGDLLHTRSALGWHDVRDVPGRCFSFMTFTY